MKKRCYRYFAHTHTRITCSICNHFIQTIRKRSIPLWNPELRIRHSLSPLPSTRHFSGNFPPKGAPQVWLANGKTTPSGSQPIALRLGGTSASILLPHYALPRGRVPPHRVSKKVGKKTLVNVSPLTAAAAAEPPAFRAPLTDARGGKAPRWIRWLLLLTRARARRGSW